MSDFIGAAMFSLVVGLMAGLMLSILFSIAGYEVTTRATVTLGAFVLVTAWITASIMAVSDWK